MKELIVAESAGFCFGVSRSVDMAESLLRSEGNCASLGQLIHNEDVVNKLKDSGLRVISSADELSEGERVIIRAHGVSRRVYEALEARMAEEAAQNGN